MRKEVLTQKEIVTLGIIFLCVGTSLLPIISGESVPKDSPAQSGDDWWPMFHHDLTHTGFSTSKAPNSANLVWSFQTETLILSCPIVVDGRTYIGSYQTYYCLNADTGEKIWGCATNGWAEGNPAIDNGRFYAPVRNQYADNTMMCLDATTGQFLWNYTDCYWPFNPVVSDGKLYFGSLDGYVRSLDALDGSLIWSFATNSVGTSNAPALSDGKLYIGAANGRMYCLDASNGNELWNYTTGGKIMESPAVADGKVYFGSCDYKIYCLNADTGLSVWNYTTDYYVDSTPAIAYGKLYIGSRDCFLYCLEADTGYFVWMFGANDEVDSSPAVADGNVYVGSDDGNLYCLNANTGTELWNYNTGTYIESSPAIANGKLYIGSYDTFVYCFGSTLAADFTWTPTTPTHGQTVTFNATSSYDPNGHITSYAWDWNHDGVYDETSASSLATHLWSDPGSYPVTLRITSATNQTATATKIVTIADQAPAPPSITGPASGKTGKKISYVFTSTDPEQDTISYFIDWGDNATSGWLGPFASGESTTQSHTWTTKGTYVIKAKAKDAFGHESDWGTLHVTMPLSYEQPQFQFFKWLFERFPNAFPLLRHLMGY